MPIDYPLRKNHHDLDISVDVCECGHGHYLHPISKWPKRGACEYCLCPEFKKEQTMTQRESIKLQRQIDQKKYESGFSQ